MECGGGERIELMHRFFSDEISDGTAWIRGEDVRHIRKVLRLAPGDSVTLCDGHGTDYDTVIRSISSDSVELGIRTSKLSESEPCTRITLYQCLPKSGKMEWIVQKGTELGVHSIVPVLSERCVVQPGERFEQRRVRYQRVAEEAAKQSRRGVIPQVGELIRIQDLAPQRDSLLLVCDEEERGMTLKQALRRGPVPADIGILIGPEGGLERSETTLLAARGGVCVTLGRRILRTETAGLAVLAQILFEVEG